MSIFNKRLSQVFASGLLAGASLLAAGNALADDQSQVQERMQKAALDNKNRELAKCEVHASTQRESARGLGGKADKSDKQLATCRQRAETRYTERLDFIKTQNPQMRK